jgi:hypothetical protein
MVTRLSVELFRNSAWYPHRVAITGGIVGEIVRGILIERLSPRLRGKKTIK